MKIKLKLLPHGENIDLPTYATEGSAGLDLRAAIPAEQPIIIKPRARKSIPTGIAIAIPNEYNAEVRSRSGLAYHNGVIVLNSPGTIDSDYRGEMKVILINLGENDFIVERNMRIAQLIIQKYEKITWESVISLDETIRSDGGYGSTGIK